MYIPTAVHSLWPIDPYKCMIINFKYVTNNFLLSPGKLARNSPHKWYNYRETENLHTYEKTPALSEYNESWVIGSEPEPPYWKKLGLKRTLRNISANMNCTWKYVQIKIRVCTVTFSEVFFLWLYYRDWWRYGLERN